MLNSNIPCPCGANSTYGACCGRYISGTINNPRNAPTAEALMRSRYTAYTLNDENYLRSTWEPRACPSERIVHEEPTKWLGLEVRKSTQDGDHATVEFVARYKIGGKAHRLHELSRFVREDGRWLYVDGTFPQSK